jgi:hypothetical protein
MVTAITLAVVSGCINMRTLGEAGSIVLVVTFAYVCGFAGPVSPDCPLFGEKSSACDFLFSKTRKTPRANGSDIHRHHASSGERMYQHAHIGRSWIYCSCCHIRLCMTSWLCEMRQVWTSLPWIESTALKTRHGDRTQEESVVSGCINMRTLGEAGSIVLVVTFAYVCGLVGWLAL